MQTAEILFFKYRLSNWNDSNQKEKKHNRNFRLRVFIQLLTHWGLLILRLSLMVIFVHGLSESSSSSFPNSSFGSSFFTSGVTVTLGGGRGEPASTGFSGVSSGSALTEVSPGTGDTLSLIVTV